jgi:intein/homing endonuclease
MNIIKLKYTDKQTAITDLLAKSVYVEIDSELVYGEGVHAIVELGKIVLSEVEPIFADGYHYDIMIEQEVDFAENAIIVNNPKHNFAGYEVKL